LPSGRKSDRDFDMNDSRQKVTAIMGGTAARPSLIPAVDTANRPTLRRGAMGSLVQQLQSKLPDVPADGNFGPGTEAAVRQFQRDKGLVPDGIVGPQTWAALNP